MSIPKEEGCKNENNEEQGKALRSFQIVSRIYVTPYSGRRSTPRHSTVQIESNRLGFGEGKDEPTTRPSQSLDLYGIINMNTKTLT